MEFEEEQLQQEPNAGLSTGDSRETGTLSGDFDAKEVTDKAASKEETVTYALRFFTPDGGLFYSETLEQGAQIKAPAKEPEAPEGSIFIGWFEEGAENHSALRAAK